MPLDGSKARTQLGPYFEDFCEIHAHAWETWSRQLDSDADFAAAIGPTAEATVINDLVCHGARTRFEADGAVRVSDDLGFLTLGIGDFLVRFKKLNRRGMPTNYPTEQQKLIGDQEPNLFGEATTMVVAGYKLDPAGQELDDVRILCPYRGGLDWWFSIAGGGFEEQYQFVPAGTPEDGPRFQIRVPRPSTQ